MPRRWGGPSVLILLLLPLPLLLPGGAVGREAGTRTNWTALVNSHLKDVEEQSGVWRWALLTNVPLLCMVSWKEDFPQLSFQGNVTKLTVQHRGQPPETEQHEIRIRGAILRSAGPPICWYTSNGTFSNQPEVTRSCLPLINFTYTLEVNIPQGQGHPTHRNLTLLGIHGTLQCTPNGKESSEGSGGYFGHIRNASSLPDPERKCAEGRGGVWTPLTDCSTGIFRCIPHNGNGTLLLTWDNHIRNHTYTEAAAPGLYALPWGTRHPGLWKAFTSPTLSHGDRQGPLVRLP